MPSYIPLEGEFDQDKMTTRPPTHTAPTPSTKDPNLDVNFSDYEVDEPDIAIYRKFGTLPSPEDIFPLGWETTRYGFHDDFDVPPAKYIFPGDEYEYPLINIDGPLRLDNIKEHPSYYFLLEVQEPYEKIKKDIDSDDYLETECYTKVHLELGLLAAKILHYAANYGRSISPSWTLAKEVPDGTL